MNPQTDTHEQAQRGQRAAALSLGFDRQEHLAELTNKIGEWKKDVQRYEEGGQGGKAREVRSWIKSAERVAELLRELEGAGANSIR